MYFLFLELPAKRLEISKIDINALISKQKSLGLGSLKSLLKYNLVETVGPQILLLKWQLK